MRAVAAMVIALGMLFVSRGACAQDAETLAHQRFLRGVQRYDAREYGVALDEFRASYALYASPNSRLYIARSLRDLGQLTEAVVEYDTTVAEASERARADARFEATRSAAVDERAALDARVGRLVLIIPDVPLLARVRVGGRVVPRGALGLALPLEPGDVTVQIEADGYRAENRAVAIAARHTTALTVNLARDDRAPSSASLIAPARERAGHASRTSGAMPWLFHGRGAMRAAAIAGYAVGMIGWIAGAAFALAADATYGELRARCGAAPCAPTEAATIDRGRALEVLTNVSLLMGLVGTVAGSALWLAGSRAESRPPRAGISAGLASVALHLVFP